MGREPLYHWVVEILMAHLPPGGYPNLATKQDLLEMEARVNTHTLRTVLTANLALAAVFAGIAFTAAGIGGLRS